MRVSPPAPRASLLFCALLWPLPAGAIVFRSFDFATNVRLANMPTGHEENPAFPFGPANARGIAWPDRPDEWTRQMALISPRHFIFANHYTIPEGWSLNFQLADGTLASRAILSTQTVLNAQGQVTDLLLGTLATPLNAVDTGISPYPVANLASDAAYLNQRAWVFGKIAMAGRGTLAGFGTLTDAGFDHTRFIYFDYKNSGGAVDDCYFENGDSGSPTFIVENGQPALVGTHSYIGNASGGHRSYDAFIPDYLPQLDAMMAVQGYHIKRLHPAATAMGISAAAPVALVPNQAGTLAITAANTGAADAHNLSLSVSFSRPPDSLSGDGWICEQQPGFGTWLCYRGGVTQSGASPALNATWSDAGETGTIKVNGSATWDGAAAPASLTASFAVGSSLYAEWTGDLVQSGVGEDPDRDGFINLIEYAFGGDPTVASTTGIGGQPLLPVLSGNAYRFTRRTDAAQRGLIYHVETSTDLNNWSEALPSGSTIHETSFTPAVNGFDTEQITIPQGEPARWYRVRVEITP